MRDVDQAVSGSVEHGFERFAERRGIGAVRDHEPFVGAEPQSRAANALARRPESHRRLGAEGNPAGDAGALAAAQDEAGGRRRLRQGESRTKQEGQGLRAASAD